MKNGCISVSSNTNIVLEDSLFYFCINAGPAVLSYSSQINGCAVARICCYDCYSNYNSHGQILVIFTNGVDKCLSSSFTRVTYQSNRGMFSFHLNGKQSIAQCNYSGLISLYYSSTYMKNGENGIMEYTTHVNNVASVYICLGFDQGIQEVVKNNVINNSCPYSSYAVFYNDYHATTYATTCVFYKNNGIYFGHYGGIMQISNSWSDQSTSFSYNSEGSIIINVFAEEHKGHTLSHFSTGYCIVYHDKSTFSQRGYLGMIKVGVLMSLIK